MLDKKRLLEIMLTARESDLREMSLLKQGKGWFHVGGMGHEALACLSLLLRDDDVISTHYRDKAIVLGRGLDVDYFARAYYGKRDSYSRGRQLLGHYSWRPRNIWSMPSPTPSHLLPACGIAWAMKLQGKTSLSVACLGDGGARQGEFFESLAFAVERNLPLLLVVEDNHFAISTDTRKMNPLHLGMLDESRVTQVNGRDVDILAAAFQENIEHIRAGGGPRIMWCDLDRLSSHTSSDDHSGYRAAEELANEQKNDVLQVSMNRMVDQNAMPLGELEAMRQRVSVRVAQAYAEAESHSNPQQEDLFPELLGPAPAAQPISLPNAQRERMADAVNGFFHQILDRDDRVVFFGEDIEDPKGGVFRLTKGLSTKFPNRVFNSPLAEATILGVACGMASYGMRPIFELQFIDFVGPGWNQLVNNLATLRWRSNGQWNCPAVVYAPCGAYLPGGGMWHSQAGGSPLAQHPGLRVAIPSTPDDAAGIFQTALT
ncbi:MAG: hypothetical protein KDB05_25410, partial [Planctomycetales bacterium]|nr:hypothetical protein [Planctomycetales bacterium]